MSLKLARRGARFASALVFLASASTVAEAKLYSIHSFHGFAGSNPQAPLVQGPDGTLYGTTLYGGGSCDCGTVFAVAPNGTTYPLAVFDGANGAYPSAGLVLGPDGNLYGTTSGGGTFSLGTIFRVNRYGNFTTLVNFDGQTGANPQAELTLGPDGNFYGAVNRANTVPLGLVIFRMTPEGDFTPIYQRVDNVSGASPFGHLALASDGNFYGTTFSGGEYDKGTIFKVSPSGTFTTLKSFAGGFDGGNPHGSLMQASDGNLYGYTFTGGSHGLVFRATLAGDVTTLSYLSWYPTGADLQGPFVEKDGALYVAGHLGGEHGDGTVTKLTFDGQVSIEQSFQNAGAGPARPRGGLFLGHDRSLYGVSWEGGYSNRGTVFVLDDSPAPNWSGPTPAQDTVFNLHSGVPFSVALAASDADSSKINSISAYEDRLPPGALLYRADGNPATAQFEWTPSAGQSTTVSFRACHTFGAVCADNRRLRFIVSKRATAMQAKPEVLRITPTEVHLRMKALLSTTSPATPVAGRVVVFLSPSGRELCRASTDGTGTAACGTPLTYLRTLVNQGYVARFAGDDAYEASSATGALIQ